MPRRRRTRRSPREEYHAGHRRQLLTGRDFGLPRPAFGRGERFRREEAVEAWARLRGEILADHLERHPCTRPWAWWHLEPRELRRRVDGGRHPCLPPLATPAIYGLPRYVSGSRPEEFHALYESVPAYLARLGLLTGPERAYLDENPDLLAPVHADDLGGWRRT